MPEVPGVEKRSQGSVSWGFSQALRVAFSSSEVLAPGMGV